MSNLLEISKAYADKIRCLCTAYLIVWKTEEKWNIKEIYPVNKLGSLIAWFEDEEAEKAVKILEQDPNAAVIYCCEDFRYFRSRLTTINKVAEYIRRCYEDGTDKLSKEIFMIIREDIT